MACAYLTALNPLRPWENHPFSINSTALFRSYKHALAPTSTLSEHSLSDSGRDMEKQADNVLETSVVHDVDETGGTRGVTLIIKKNTGLTRLLKTHSRLLTLLDGPYPQNPSSEILKCDHVLLIGDGIGITALIPWIHAHPNVKLAWSVKSSAEALVYKMDILLRDMAEKEVVVGQRLHIEASLKIEVQAGYGKVGVVVCGPGGMCDGVRARVAGLGRGGKTVFELKVDSFSW